MTATRGGGREAHPEPGVAGAAGGTVTTPTLFTVVLCTYNRADRVEGAVRAILAQEGCEFELVVVDDGSTDATPAVLASIDDRRLQVLRRPNGGLSKARNTGLAAAASEWVTFIDDDDMAEPGWLATFRQQTTDPTVGIVCCGARFVSVEGTVFFTHPPGPLGEPYGDGVGSSLAGTFAARTELLRRAGGYLDGLGNRHQSELFIRLLTVARAEGLRMTSVNALMINIEARPATERRDVYPRRLYDASRWILARHVEAFAGQATAVGRFEGIAGINAARLGDWPAARRHLARSVRASPRSRETWGRLALACIPAVGRRVWHRHGDWNTGGRLGVLDQTTDDGSGERELFLTWGYHENPAIAGGPGDAGGTAAPAAGLRAAPGGDDRAPPAPVRRLVDRLARRRGWVPVVEIGCDAATAAAETGGGDAGPRPGVVLCLDVIHRVDDPVGLLRGLARLAGGAPVLLSTPDRAVTDPHRPSGPPRDPRHRYEWSYDQFELLLHSTGFDVERTWHVRSGRAVPAGAGRPRSLAAARRAVRAGLRRRRSVMVVLARARAAPEHRRGTGPGCSRYARA